MGLLVDGQWHDQWYDTKSTGGRFERSAAQFRNWVTADGRPGPDGEGGFAAEAGRYHLYVSLACPWAHRTLIFRQLKGLASMIDVSVVNPLMFEYGWPLNDDFPGATGDRLYGLDYLYQLYQKANPDYSGRVTVPVLWDCARETIVSNESADIIRMFNTAFDDIGAAPGDYYPEALREKIDTLNTPIYDQVNNGVYKAGFATTQAAYEEAVTALFARLDTLDALLGQQRWLAGDTLTEADWRLFTTLVRFDAVYVGHFKCNRQRIADYRHLSGYLRDLYQQPGIADTCNFEHIKQHYYRSHPSVNPTRIVPIGPALHLDQAHDRAEKFSGEHLAGEQFTGEK